MLFFDSLDSVVNLLHKLQPLVVGYIWVLTVVKLHCSACYSPCDFTVVSSV